MKFGLPVLSLAIAMIAHATPPPVEPEDPQGPVFGPLDEDRDPGFFWALSRGARIDCDGTGCMSVEGTVRCNFPPGQEAQFLETESVREQRKRIPEFAERTEQILAEVEAAAAFGDEGELTVMVELWEEPFDHSSLRNVRHDDPERARLIEDRRMQLSPSQERFIEAVEALGAHVSWRGWLVNLVAVEVPKASLSEIARLPGVAGISLTHTMRPLGPANGKERQIGLGAVDTPQDGGSGARTDGNEIRIAVIEAEEGGGNTLNTTHVGWLDYVGGPSRIIDTDLCQLAGGYYSCGGTASGSVETHGTRVTSILAGSIEQGQDGNFPGSNTLEQNKRSGLAREAEIYYYRAVGQTPSVAVAIQDAVGLGVDIINLSFGTDGVNNCSGTAETGGVRSAILAAENAGVVLVAAAGTPSCVFSGCTVEFPAALTDVMGIAALEATDGVGYGDAGIDGNSACGRVETPVSGGDIYWAPMIDLITFGSPDLYYTGGANGYGTGVNGTSYAAPVVSSAAALTREWMYDHGWTAYDDPYAVRLNLLLMGDSAISADEHWDYSIHGVFGLGVLRYRFFSSSPTSQLGSVSGWGIHPFTIQTGQSVAFSLGGGSPASSSINGWKLAVIADENAYGDMPDLHVRIVDTCPSGGGVTTIQTAARYAGRWRIRLDNPGSQIHGRCLEARITADSTDGPVNVWAGDYYFSNDVALHFAD